MTGSDKSGDSKRDQRLKAALRDNLKRRKARERARSEEATKAPGPVRSRESGDPGP